MFYRIIVAALCLLLLTITLSAEQVPMKWQYGVAATKYWECLLIGTGRFGVMIPSNVDHEVIANIETYRKAVKAWQEERNRLDGSMTWQFTSKNARIKLKQLYPQIGMG